MLHEVLIDKDNTRAFEVLVPEMYIDDIKNERLYGVATFDGRIERDTLVGVVLVRARFQWQEIVWVALTEKYAGCEYGADIIKNRAEDARDRGYLLGTYSEFPGEEVLRREYFSCAGFSYEKIPAHTFSIYTRVLMKRPLEINEEEDAHCFSLKYITADQREKMQEDASEGKKPSPLEYPIDWDSYDGDASVLYEEEGIVVGGILICKNDEFYSVEGLFGDRQEIFKSLFEHLKKKSKKVLADRPLLVIPAITAAIEDSLESWPITQRGELALACLGFENVKKRKPLSNEDLKEYAGFSEAYLLGIEGMNVCGELERIDMPIDGQGLAEFSYDTTRKKEEAYERHWKKIEAWCERIGLPPIMIIVQDLAAKGYKMYKDGKAEPTPLSGVGFTVRPLSTVEERKRMTAQFAGLIVTEEQMREELADKPKDTLYDRAKYVVDTKIINTISDVVEAFFGITGINIHTGEKIPSKDRVRTAIKSRALMSKYNKLVMGYETMITEEMIAEVEQEAGFEENLKAKSIELAKENAEAFKERCDEIRSSNAYSDKKEDFEKAIQNRSGLVNQLAALDAKIALLSEKEEFEDRKQLLEDIYFYRKRTINYYIDSVDAYISYLTDGTPIKAMQGIYIRKKLDKNAPCPNPNERLDKQISKLDPRFEELAPWEMDNATILLGWERMLYRTGKKTDEQVTIEADLESCRTMLDALEAKKDAHPELFRELLLTNMWNEIPEMMELFDEAKELRDAASILLDEGLSNLDEKYGIYEKSLAIYDTLLRRARHIIVASRMTMNELMDINPDYHTTDYSYCLKESARISTGR